MTKRGVIGIAVAALALSAMPAAAKTGGWVVRICRGFTEAAKIKITVGPPNGKTHLLVNWRSDNKKTDFAVHGKLASAKQIHVNADSEPADGKVAMCVLHGTAVAKAMNFTDILDVTASQGDTDSTCQCPKKGSQ